VRILKFKLIEIEIENFLSYKKARFTDIKNYNVLVGKNNSGKSNLIKILKFFGDHFSDSIKESVSNFNTSLLFDSNIEETANISLIFKLSKDFRRDIFNKLSNYLKKFLKGMDKEGLINKLTSEEYLNSLKFTFEFDKIMGNLYLKQIEGIHKESREAFPILQGSVDDNNLHIISNKTHEMAINIEECFGKNFRNHKNYSKSELFNTLRTMSKPQGLEENNLLRTIMNEFFKCFKNRIKYIPATRILPKKSSDRANKGSSLLESGENFVQFIFYKQNIIGGDQWMKDYVKELFYFFPDNVKFATDSSSGNPEAYFLESNLTMPIKDENMGSAFMHIAFLVAFIKELGENDILLIEEPELFIFPGLQIKIRDWFLEKSQKSKIFITTHSTKFLSENDDKCSIYSIQKENNESIVKLVPNDKVEDIFDDLNINLTEYEKDKVILYDSTFWNSFILKAMQNKQIEDKLWDFKQILEWWKPGCNVKEQKQIEFCEKVAGFANSKGGVLIIGITNKFPRKIIDVEGIETRIQDCRKKIRNYIDYKREFYHIRAIKLKDQDGMAKNCIIIVVKQTKKVIGVRHGKGYISFKVRTQTGVESINRDMIKENKKGIVYDNYKFLNYLKRFSESTDS